MTDLPQLELLLIDAAERRHRRRRLRRTGVKALAVATVTLLVVSSLVRDDPELEIPAVPPTPRASTFDEAFGVFRRAELPSDKAPGAKPGDESRLIASNADVKAYLIHRGSRMCVATNLDPTPACGPVSLDPKEPQGYYFNDDGDGGRIILAFPDGVSAVSVGKTSYPVRTNGVIIDVPKWPVELSWMTPDGPASRIYQSAGAPSVEMSFGVLREPANPAESLDGFPSSRRLYASPDVSAWLVPRDGKVCLVVHVVDAGREGSRSACRRQIDNVHPIIMGVPHGPTSHIVAMVFPDGVRAPGMDDNGFLLIRDGQSAVNVRYTDQAGEQRVSWFPEGVAGFVMHAKAEQP
jgi:hypothetical protein